VQQVLLTEHMNDSMWVCNAEGRDKAVAAYQDLLAPYHQSLLSAYLGYDVSESSLLTGG
jgi:hypothetical protein